MTKAILLNRTGGPEVLVPGHLDLPAPGPGEVRLRHTFIGVNYVDIYHRQGLYPLPGLPAVPGVEGAGIVEEVGSGVAGLREGGRVAYAGLPAGGYAESRLIPADRLVPIPDGVGDRAAAALIFRGTTAHMLLHRVHPVGPGTTVLVHAAAGGLGLILTQWAKRLGAVVIGTVGSAGKAEIARGMGLDHAIIHREADFVAGVRDLTGGRGVDVAYDGIGGGTLARTFDAVRPFGTVASIGQAGGAIPPIEVSQLGPRRSLSLSRPSVLAYAADPASYREATRAVFAAAAQGLEARVGAEYALDEAARAHEALENGRTTGSVLLVP